MDNLNIHLLEKEIHSTFDPSVFSGGIFESKLVKIATYYPYQDSENYNSFVHAIQELNKKLDKFGLTSQIIQPVDAGFRPLNFEDFFGNFPSLGLSDYLELENDLFLFQENGFKLILEQDI